MEIFITNIPITCGDDQLRRELAEPLTRSGVSSFNISAWKPKHNHRYQPSKLGRLVLAEAGPGGIFLQRHGRSKGQPALIPIRIINQDIHFERSRNPPNELSIKSLRWEEDQKEHYAADRVPVEKDATIKILNLHCGAWVPNDKVPDFVSYYENSALGSLDVSKGSIRIKYSERHTLDLLEKTTYIDFLNFNIRSIVAGGRSITITAAYPPRFYQESRVAELFSPGSSQRQRVPYLDEQHRECASFCFVYRVDVDPMDLHKFIGAVRSPTITRFSTDVRVGMPLHLALTKLYNDLKGYDFAVAFQLHTLAANGLLLPDAVREILPGVSSLVRRLGNEKTAAVLKTFACNESQDALDDTLTWTAPAIVGSLNDIAKRLMGERHDAMKTFRQEKLISIHQAHITPAGVYFTGPKLEPSNRILRQYCDYHGYFLRVCIVEEDGGDLFFERDVTLEPIFLRHLRPFFSTDSISFCIAGRTFRFLGFSQSSLRMKSCWFMAPFRDGSTTVDASSLIHGLGDFSRIRTPGRYAARVGQAFTGTVDSVHIPVETESVIPDVIRNGRVFSDGVGCISPLLLHKIQDEGDWDHSKTRPTVFQIRFAGAKGVVALNTSLTGDKLCLRKSMIKFEGSKARTFEICNANTRPLPLFLNRPLIKILENRGVLDEVFLNLQKDALLRVQEASKLPRLLSHFLSKQNIGTKAHLPFLVKALYQIGLTFSDDEFLRQVSELALLVTLKKLKYKMNIEVPKGYTLIGIMDETGELAEGEVYCAIEMSIDDGFQRFGIQGKVMVTRSPAMHPGDVQTATAVRVKSDSPLRYLTNCIVFSQNGSRDMPSMLGGGDLDGDLYNICWDSGLLPKTQAEPAAYPSTEPVLLDRPVEQNDVSTFFLDFIRNDRLGQISIAHLVIADQQDSGVFHPDCIKLAEMASVAVDFPKTGKAVDMRKMPRYSDPKPDFLAPGPQVHVEREIRVDAAPIFEEKGRYYRSEKIMGQLYRVIDEQAFIKEHRRDAAAPKPSRKVLRQVAEYVRPYSKGNTDVFSQFAADVKSSYEENVADLMSGYSDRTAPLKEVEVFIGCIVGRDRRQSKKQRDASDGLREEFDRVLLFTRGVISQGSEQFAENGDERNCLERALACLDLVTKGKGTMVSFGWVAATMALQEVDKIQRRSRQKRRT